MTSKLIRAFFVVMVILCVVVASTASLVGPFKISDVTVSGVSSGGYMAVQFHVAHSQVVNGSAIFAGGPFYCAQSTLLYAENMCMGISLGTPQTDKLIALTWTDASLLYIDNPKYMADDRVYLFSGKGDSVVDPKVVKELHTYYSAFVKPENIVSDYNFNAEHCFPTLDYGEPCLTLSSPFLGKCGFDGAGAAFTALFGSSTKKGIAIASNLKKFDQKSYITRIYSSLGDTGYVYIPTACDSKTSCRLHISFHGCEQNVELIGNDYAKNTGLNDWAEANNVIVLYPYVKPSSVSPLNPNGCWDWWAYSGVDYGVKTGVQIEFVKLLVDSLSKGGLRAA